jgi:hypothetical protein
MFKKIKGRKRKMQIIKNKKATTAIVIFLITAIIATTVLIPLTNAHSPPWTIVSYAYLSAAPNPVGVGQTMDIVMWVDAPLVGATVANDIRRHDYSLTITKPDGTTETKNWPIVDDTTSIQFFQYTPDQLGTYTLKFDYKGQIYTWANPTYQNDTILPASKTTTFTVQQEPIPAPIDSFPLPTEYWTRPIEGQNTYWYSIASNWLGTPYILGANPSYGVPGAYQPNGLAPNSAHIMWAKQIQYGGIVGGSNTTVPGEMYYQGGSYNVRWNNPIIMQGTLFYQEPLGNSGTGGDYVSVDLTTGKELWRINATATGVSLVPSFGYLYALETPNQHGVLPNGALIASTTAYSGLGTVWRAYDPRTGYLTNMNVSNVPSGTSVAGPQGELLRYTLTNLGNTTAPKYYLTEWNSSLVFGGAAGTGVGGWYSGNTPANCPFNYSSLGTNNNWNGTMWVNSTVRTAQGYAAVSTPAYDWNISLSTLSTTGWSIGTAALGAIPLIEFDKLLLLIQGTFGGHPGDFSATVALDPANITAISLKPSTLGQVLWTKSYPQAPGNNSRQLSAWDPDGAVFTFDDKEDMSHYGYSLNDGSYLWGPSFTYNDSSNDWNFLALGQTLMAYGKIYWTGYSGILYCFDEQTGNILWTYGNGGEGNSTFSGLATPYGHYPTFISVVADGKIFLASTEHSPNSPIYKGEQMRAINATDGKEIWTISNDGNQMYGGIAPVADGYLTMLNTYDCRIYAIGKGPSALTISAPDLAASFGQAVVIRGTITDIAAGTSQNEQAARFPNGVPAVSDASMSKWMEYVYMQKPRPTDTTGVPVSIDVVDANGNYRNIGVATSDANGVFSYTWTPDIEGSYTVIATFKGSESYFPSHAETSFAVMGATPTPSPQPVAAAPAPVEMYFVGSTIAILIAVAIATLLIIKKK